VPSPLLYGDFLYLVNDMASIATALHAATGEVLWQGRLGVATREGFSASPVGVDNKVFFTNDEGETFVLRAGGAFNLMHVNKLDAQVLASPALVDRKWYFRPTEAPGNRCAMKWISIASAAAVLCVLAGSCRTTAAQGTAWLDRPIENWNKPGAAVPRGPADRSDHDDALERCKAKPPQTHVPSSAARFSSYRSRVGRRRRDHRRFRARQRAHDGLQPVRVRWWTLRGAVAAADAPGTDAAAGWWFADDGITAEFAAQAATRRAALVACERALPVERRLMDRSSCRSTSRRQEH
jgi:hypothetical protein